MRLARHGNRRAPDARGENFPALPKPRIRNMDSVPDTRFHSRGLVGGQPIHALETRTSWSDRSFNPRNHQAIDPDAVLEARPRH